MMSALRARVTVAAAVALLPPIVFGALWSEYSAVRDYISELGAAGAPRAGAVNGSFALAGAAIVWACVTFGRTMPRLRGPMWMLAALGVSYLVAAVVPCDTGCPAEGSSSQALHNTVGALGYLVGGLGLLAAGKVDAARGAAPLAWGARLAGVAVIGGLIAMGAPELDSVRGLAQRAVELAAFAWLLAAAWTAPPPAAR